MLCVRAGPLELAAMKSVYDIMTVPPKRERPASLPSFPQAFVALIAFDGAAAPGAEAEQGAPKISNALKATRETTLEFQSGLAHKQDCLRHLCCL